MAISPAQAARAAHDSLNHEAIDAAEKRIDEALGRGERTFYDVNPRLRNGKRWGLREEGELLSRYRQAGWQIDERFDSRDQCMYYTFSASEDEG